MSNIQSILFDKSKWTLPKAKQWLKKRHYKTGLDDKPNHYRFRQQEPNKNDKYITKKIDDGIEFIVKINNFKGGKFEYEISEQAYKNPKERINFDGYVYEPSLSNKKTAVYKSDDDKIIIIGHRGTVPTDIEDLADDLAIVTGTFKFTSRFKKALKINEQITKKYPDYTIVNTGHSLGARIASDVAKKQYLKNSKAITYAQPTVPIDLITNTIDKVKNIFNPNSNMAKKMKNQESNVTRFDPISSLNIISPTGKVNVHNVSASNPHTLQNFKGKSLNKNNKIPFDIADKLSAEIKSDYKRRKITLYQVGSLARRSKLVGDLDFITTSPKLGKKYYKEKLELPDGKTIMIDIWFVPKQHLKLAKAIRSYPRYYIIAIRKGLKNNGYKLTDQQLFNSDGNEIKYTNFKQIAKLADVIYHPLSYYHEF